MDQALFIPPFTPTACLDVIGDIPPDVLIRGFTDTVGIVDDQIEGYNDWMDSGKKRTKQIEDIRLTYPGTNKHIYFKETRVIPPRIKDLSAANSKQKHPLMTPAYARKYNKTYAGTVVVDMYDDDGNVMKDIEFINIPIVLGSTYDNISYKNLSAQTGETNVDKIDDMRVQLGEYPKDTGGYSIVYGNEIVIQLTDRLAPNRPLIRYFAKTNKISHRYIAPTATSPELINVEFDIRSSSLILALPTIVSSKNNQDTGKPEKVEFGINLYAFFRVMTKDATNFLTEYILKFVTDTSKANKIIYNLQSTIMKGSDMNLESDVYSMFPVDNSIEELDTEYAKRRWVQYLIITKFMRSDPIPSTYDRGQIYEFFDAIDSSTSSDDLERKHAELYGIYKRKLFTVGYLATGLLEYRSRYRSLSDLDSWSNKALESPGKIIETLFRSILNKFVADSNKDLIARSNSGNVLLNLNSVYLAIVSAMESMSETINYAYHVSWGVRGQHIRENVTEILNRDSPIAVPRRLTRINSKTSRHTRQASIRDVQLSQTGFVCAADTPEGKNCGIVKAKAITARITLDRDSRRVVEFLSGKLVLDNAITNTLYRQITESIVHINSVATNIFHQLQPSTHRTNLIPVFVNGKFMGWGQGESLRMELVRARRSGLFHYETGIALVDNTLFISTESSRIVRPLLIMDGEIPVLIRLIQEGKLKASDSFDKLISAGAVEYIDTLEQDQKYTLIAQGIRYVTDNIRLYRDAMTLIENLKQRLSSLRVSDTQSASAEDDSGSTEQTREFVGTIGSSVSSGQTNRALDILNEMKTEEGWGNLSYVFDNIDVTETGQWIRGRDTVESLEILIEQLMTLARRRINVRYSHCELDPLAILGVAANNVPFSHMNQGPRNSYACNHMSQATGIVSRAASLRFDTTSKMLAFPCIPLVSTTIHKAMGMIENPSTVQIMLAIAIHGGGNQEDSIIVNKATIDSGKLSTIIYKSFSTTVSVGNRELIANPLKRITGMTKEKSDRYHALDDDGMPRINAYVKHGDYIIGKLIAVDDGFKDVSVSLKLEEGGYIDDAIRFVNKSDNEEVIKVRIRHMRSPILGDKLASRSAQKGTIGEIRSASDMPFTENGVQPDIILNLLAIPSRMTIGKLVEMLTGNLSLLSGQRYDGSAFREINIDDIRRQLNDLNYERKTGVSGEGTQTLYSGITGEPLMNAEIYMGPCAYMVLSHMVTDKYQVRDTGANKLVTRQPGGGRKAGGSAACGSTRMGAMELQALISHGASAFVTERYRDLSDNFESIWCSRCSGKASFVPSAGSYTCLRCASSLELVKVNMPFATILMSNLLVGAGVELSFNFRKQIARLPV